MSGWLPPPACSCRSAAALHSHRKSSEMLVQHLLADRDARTKEIEFSANTS